MPPARRGTRPASRGRGTRARQAAGTDSPESGGRYGEPAPVDIEINDLGAVDEPINILLYGPSGVGKTALASGAPSPIYLSTEKGVISARHTGNSARVIQAKNWPHTHSGIRWAEANLKRGDWFIVDSSTRMQQMMLAWVLETQVEQSSRRDLDLAEVQDHQKWQNMYRRFIDRIYDMPCNTITIATSMTREDRNGDDEVLPELMGGERWQQISHYMCSQAGVVLYYALAKEKDDDGMPVRYALAQPSPPYAAKDRYDALGFGQYVYYDEYDQMGQWIKLIEASPAYQKSAA